MTSQLNLTHYQELLAIRLVPLFDHFFFLCALPYSMSEAVVILVLKPSKDSEDCPSYRPISLKNVDAQILANRLAKGIGDFSCGPNLTYAQEGHQSQPLCPIPIVGIWSSFPWTLKWEKLHRFGFSYKFLKWLRMFYSAPKANI